MTTTADRKAAPELFTVEYILRKNVAFRLCGTAQGGRDYEDRRTSVSFLQRAINNYRTNSYLAPTGSRVTLYLWDQDRHLVETLDYQGLELQIARMEDYLTDHDRRAAAFKAGYLELVQRTGMHLYGDDCGLYLADGAPTREAA